MDGAPHGSRQSCASDGTACAGTCDSSRNTPDRCTYKGATTACRTASCANGVATLGAVCQGNGSCAPLQLQSCDPGACDANGILCTGCTVDADCDAGNYCSGGVCVPTIAKGGNCGTAGQCTNSHCVDGVCCDSACTGQCQICDEAGSVGTCTAVSGAPRNGRAACAGSGACGGFCGGTNGLSCTLPNAATSCGVAFCADGFATNTPACNGAGTCFVPAAQSCDPYVCDPKGETCLVSCEADIQCATGLVCVNGSCAQANVVPDAGPDGSVGAGGATAGSTGGSAGTDASANGQGGSVGTGGARTAVDGGVAGRPGQDAGTGSKDAGIINGEDRGSCGCRVPGRGKTENHGAAILAAAAALAALRRRKTSPRRRDMPRV